jgi:signal transduction histidine kinase
VYQDRNGAIWAATVNAGVSKYWKSRFTTYSKANGMASDTVFSIEESPDGTMWFATPNGLNAFANGEWRAYTTREGLPSDHVTCLLSDSSGTLWIGTRAGLAYLQSGHIQNISVPSLQQEILGVAADDIGNFWIATSYHILSVKRERLLSTTLTESDLRNYALEDGLAGTQGVKRFRSVVRGPQGRIWFSTNRGLSVVDPTRTGPEPTHVTVQIEGFSADGNSLDLQAPIRVPPDTHRLIFRFSGLNLSDPKRIQFKYKLEGFDRDWSEPGSTSGIDKDWHEAGTRRQAFYMNLAPRKYTFHVIASNSEGVWNEAGASLDFSVQPAWYQTIWFRVSCLGAFFLMLWAAYQLRLQQMERQFNIRLEERVGERSRIARDLHDTLLQSFHGLLLRFQTAFSLLPERPDEAKQSLGSAIDQAALAITEGRDAVQNLRSSTVETNDLAVAIRAVGEELSAGETNRNTPVFQVEVEGTPRSLHLILRDEIYRIAAEALRNAFRHAQARRIEVELRYDDTQFRLRIRDDGKGIKPKVLGENGYAGHYGLPGMRERAKLVGGKLTVWSEHDSGTEIELTIPATAAYAASPRRSWWLEKFPGKGTSETDTRMRS